LKEQLGQTRTSKPSFTGDVDSLDKPYAYCTDYGSHSDQLAASRESENKTLAPLPN
jgi:hypothetical protein